MAVCTQIDRPVGRQRLSRQSIDRLNRPGGQALSRRASHRARRRKTSVIGLTCLECGEPRLGSRLGKCAGFLGDDLLAHLIANCIERPDLGRLVLDDARRRHQPRGNLDGLCIALVAHHIVIEDRRQQPGIGKRRTRCGARRRLAGHTVGRADLQLVLVGSGFERVGLLVDRVGEGIGRLGKLLSGLLETDFLIDLGTHRLKGLLGCRANRGQLDDVLSELGFNRTDNIAVLD